MARLKDIIGGLGKQSTRIHEELVKVSDERAKLQEAAQRFRDLEEMIKVKDESLKIGFALLLSVPQKVNIYGDAFAEAVTEDTWEETGIAIDIDNLNVSQFPLWKVIREVLRQTSEIRVYELEEHLKSFRVKASRSAIESALATHKKEFRITRRRREKFVALK